MEDIIIIGSGNAGWTAAIYAARANLNPVVLTGFQLGGQLTTTSEIDNFPGFPEGISGMELMQNMQKQAERFGTRVIMDSASAFSKNEDGTFTVKTSSEELVAKSVIIATGASARWLGIESEKQFQGSGVHTCATCDGFFYKGKEIIVVGGGDSACEEANFLTKFADKVYLVHRRDELRASKIMQQKVFDNPKIEMVWDTSIAEYVGEGKIDHVVLHNNKTGEDSDLKIDGVFLALGHVPNTGIFKELIDLDEHGFIKSNDVVTNLEGVFCAGDVFDTKYKQAITAAGSGCRAALEAEKYLEQ